MATGNEDHDEVVFREVQRFAQPWVWAVVILVAAGGAWFFAVYHLFAENPAGEKQAPDILVLLVWLLIGLGLPALFLSARLVLEVRTSGLFYRFYPFHRSFHRITCSEIKKVEARTYRPIMEFGGWGIRYGWKGGRAYNVRGKRGVQMQLENGKEILFGSQRPEELAAAINGVKDDAR